MAKNWLKEHVRLHTKTVSTRQHNTYIRTVNRRFGILHVPSLIRAVWLFRCSICSGIPCISSVRMENRTLDAYEIQIQCQWFDEYCIWLMYRRNTTPRAGENKESWQFGAEEKRRGRHAFWLIIQLSYLCYLEYVSMLDTIFHCCTCTQRAHWIPNHLDLLFCIPAILCAANAELFNDPLWQLNWC